MEPTIELRVAELLASRLCHDLVSPVGAVNSGIELLTEFGDDPDGESMALIFSSARTASDKLLFFRIAYGNAGSGTNVPLSEGARAGGAGMPEPSHGSGDRRCQRRRYAGCGPRKAFAVPGLDGG